MDQLTWGIVYEDKPVFTNLDGEWSEAPPWGVQAVIEGNHEVGFETLAQADVYLKWKDRIIRLSELGFADYMVNVVHYAAYVGPGRPASFALSKTGEIIDERSLQFEAAKDGLIKVGRMLSSNDWRPLYNKVMAIPGLPPKGGWFPEERERFVIHDLS